jgi:hypothetical protein
MILPEVMEPTPALPLSMSQLYSNWCYSPMLPALSIKEQRYGLLEVIVSDAEIVKRLLLSAACGADELVCKVVGRGWGLLQEGGGEGWDVAVHDDWMR